MNISNAGIAAIKEYEGVRLEAYRDSVGIPTIGVGHIKGVHMGDKITDAQADSMLRADLQEAEEAVQALVAVPLTQNQYDSLVSFVFNLGRGALSGSTLLRLLNQGKYQQAAAEFPRWSNAGGHLIPGLVKRRMAERRMFETT